ncbi:hypothetical protein GY45DRAFT_1373451 [Cubamyces sp. BRFM 1775]|nr:hypothetical protein GY45DRAFT_1373451 [Cubamyces sp. BRFM 1775]
MEVKSVSNESTATPGVFDAGPYASYIPYLPPLYPVYFAPGLFKRAGSYSTDASAYTISFTGAVAWIRYHDAIYASMAAQARRTSSTSVEAAILRTSDSPSSPSEGTIPPQTSSDPLYNSSPETKAMSDPVSQAIDKALHASGACSLIDEPMPSLDDIPEIPDEDAVPHAISQDNGAWTQTVVDAPNQDDVTSQGDLSAEAVEKEGKKSMVIVSEKPRRTAKGLVKQYRSGKKKARPCAMGQTGLHTIAEEETLDLALASPLVRIYKSRKPKNKRRGRKASVKGDENAP